ncbi:MAG: hypothetical protein GY724_28290 [Actinomycetia bacterium]|nr:hypothetical protein [Actinomycetes bacterium]MCP5034167.1 hypothetical protein [Actinomycetes bacterium]
MFFVLSNPSQAGPQTRSFFGWIGDQASSAGTFLDGLFSDDDAPVGTTLPTTIPTTVTNGAGSGDDTFNTIGPIIIDTVVI